MTVDVIGLGQLRNHTCGYFDRVKHGETLGVVRRGRLVAWIRPRREDDKSSIPVPLNAFRGQAGRFFDRVAAGQHIDVVYQGAAIAHISACTPGHGPTDHRHVQSRAEGPGTC